MQHYVLVGIGWFSLYFLSIRCVCVCVKMSAYSNQCGCIDNSIYRKTFRPSLFGERILCGLCEWVTCVWWICTFLLLLFFHQTKKSFWSQHMQTVPSDCVDACNFFVGLRTWSSSQSSEWNIWSKLRRQYHYKHSHFKCLFANTF